ncbi:MFS transporter [Parafrigoribacterium mesophilum]|uniref:MFS transporter n=1 Tax=Parafrigoribacterium mesophilum TaxID=433646 RepID=UPI0031FCC57C
MTSTPERPFSLRSVALAAFLPTLVFAIGEGAIIPIIPVVAHNLGATLAVAGFIAAMIMVGELLGDIPSGWIVSRIGERTAMISASFLSIAGLVTAMVAPNPWLLAFGILLVGLATAVFALARHAFMTSYVPVAYRARALSSLGGTFRFGYFIGPFISAAVIHLSGTSQSVFWIHIGACLVAAVILLLLPDPAATFGTSRSRPHEDEKFITRQANGLFHTIWSSRGVLVKLGGGAALIGALRASRQVILPLWAVSIGISDANTALIIGVAGGVDFALFYASGQIMDRFGRMWTAIPSMVGLGAGHIVLAFTHDVPGRVVWFIGVAILLSLANGIGSGLLMTLGADLADKSDPAPFLGAWRFTSDAGSAAAPLAVALITALASVAIASSIMGAFGLLGAGILARYLPRYLPRPPATR